MLEIYIGIGVVIFFLYICEVGGLGNKFDKLSILPGLFVGILWPMAVFGLVVYLLIHQVMEYLTRD